MTGFGGAAASVEDLAALALTNYGHFTTLRVEGRRARGLMLHWERLGRDARVLFGAELDLDLARRLVRERLADGADAAGPVLARVTVFDPQLDIARPAGVRGRSPGLRILVSVRPAPPVPLSALRVRPVEYARVLPEVKDVGLFGAVRLRREAQLAGFDDVLFTRSGLVAEGATWNVGFFDGSYLVRPEAPALPGVTTALLERAFGRFRVRPIGLADLPQMAAAFATSAGIGVRPIAAVGPVRFDPVHPVIGRLQAAYAGIAGELV
jgi:branched-subunit amino acid aminotransferase/4-amino-4-deoxychorismate lyase